MAQIILIILGLAVVVILMTRKGREKTVGICVAALGLDTKKRERKEKILALLAEKRGLSNFDLREALGVSERTTTRYMEELEREGKVEQVGNTGRGVTYRLKS